MRAQMRCLAILAVLAAGCSSVKTEHPVSEHAEALDADRLEGVWLVEDEIVHLRFGDDGVGRVAALDWRDGRFRVRRCEFVVAHAGDGRYASLRCEEGEDHYDLLAYEFGENGEIVVRNEPTDAFERAVVAGKLRGEVRMKGDETELVVSSPSDSLAAFLASMPAGDLFEETAFVLRRLPAPVDAE